MSDNALIKHGWLRAIIGLPVFFVVVRLTGFLPGWIMQTLQYQLPRHAFVVNNLIFLTLGILLVRKLIDRKSFVSLGFTVKGRGKDVILSLAASFAIMASGFAILYLAGYIEITSFNFNSVSMLTVAIYILLSAALEELPMRGYMLNNMLDSMNSYVAVGIISLIFGLMHAMGDTVSVMGLINCTLLGAIVGLYYVRKRNLWVPIVFHTGWNFFQGIIFGFKVSGVSFGYSLINIDITGNDLLTGGEYGLEGSLILTCLVVPAVVLLERSYLRQNVKTPKQADHGLAGGPQLAVGT